MNSEDLSLIEELKIKQGDTWRVLKIMSEFVRGFDALSSVGPAITFFGSSRLKEDDHYYKMAYRTAFMLGSLGFHIITGGGPGIMEAANRGGKDAGTLSVGLNIQIPAEQIPNPYQEEEKDEEGFNSRTFICKPVNGSRTQKCANRSKG